MSDILKSDTISAKTDRNIKLNGNIDNVKQLLND